MITRKELNYVNAWSSKVPFPGISYCEQTMEKLQKSFNLYQNEYLDVKHTISFSNNEEIELEILSKNICHMLGIDHKNLSGEFFKTFRKDLLDYDPDATISSYELIKLIIENFEKIIEYDSKTAAKALNYYKIGIKCDIFNKLANLANFNYGCINFSKDIYEKNNPANNFNSKSTKFLYTPSDEIVSPYFMMGIKPDDATETSQSYIVETLIAPDHIKDIFIDQEVVIPTQILTDKNSILSKTEASASDKIKLLKEYQSILNQYSLNNKLNIYSDYISMLLTEERNMKK